MANTFFQIVRIDGGTDPVVFPNQISTEGDALKDAVTKYLDGWPLDMEDGLFYLYVAPHNGMFPIIEMHSFSNDFMERIGHGT